MSFERWAKNKLTTIREQGTYRTLQPIEVVGGQTKVHNRPMLNFSSNDYLNLASDPRLIEASSEAVQQYGCGATASRSTSGTLKLHEQLEESIASFVEYEAVTLFGSGFLTNYGVITSIAERDDMIFEDRLNHASLIVGSRATHASVYRYRHKDIEDLEKKLSSVSSKRGKKIIITDSLFSMDGDIAPLPEIMMLAKRFDALVIVDEAHALGAFGKGLCAQFKVKPDILIGTLGKAFGSYGGFAASSHIIRTLLINRAKSFIYSTALPPACLAASLQAIEIVKQESDLGKKVQEKAKFFAQALDLATQSPIVPLIVQSNERSLSLAQMLFDQGIFVSAIRPPTVPVGTARLRFSITLAHSHENLNYAANKIKEFL